MRKYAQKYKVAIFIDTYEALPRGGNKAKDDWLFELVKKLPEVLWVIEKSIQNVIIQGSKGVPYYLDLAVDTYEQIINSGNSLYQKILHCN